ncbi:unnamed protein product, partial [Gadus morhua 'NCC']
MVDFTDGLAPAPVFLESETLECTLWLSTAVLQKAFHTEEQKKNHSVCSSVTCSSPLQHQDHVEPAQRRRAPRPGQRPRGDHARQRQHLRLPATGAQEVRPRGGAQAQVQPLQRRLGRRLSAPSAPADQRREHPALAGLLPPPSPRRPLRAPDEGAGEDPGGEALQPRRGDRLPHQHPGRPGEQLALQAPAGT